VNVVLFPDSLTNPTRKHPQEYRYTEHNSYDAAKAYADEANRVSTKE
jgi:hypothetical protein